MKHLFASWQIFTNNYRAAPHVLLLADYDGTLTPIVGLPQEAVLSYRVKDKLVALVQKPGISVGVISGRSLTELKSLVGIEDIYYAGNHGMEIEGNGLQYVNKQAELSRDLIKDLTEQLAAALRNVEGVIIQEKGLSMSVHYRLAEPNKEGAITGAVKRLTMPHVARGDIKVYPMKKVWEVRSPVDWDKGKAVEFIGREVRANLKFPRLLTIYLGDDTTDEDAFKVLHDLEGWSIFVGSKSQFSAAEYYLNSVAEVEEFLSRLLVL